MSEKKLTKAQAEFIAEEMLAAERRLNPRPVVNPTAHFLSQLLWHRSSSRPLFDNVSNIASPASPLFPLFNRDGY